VPDPATPGRQGPLGCAIPPFEPFDAAVRLARLADQLGYDSVNLSHIAARDSFSVAAALAARTDRVTLGTSVVPIYTRSPATMAQAAATVDDVSGGRFRLGIGIGHRETMGGWHGQEIGRPTVEMREYLAIVRAILEGKPPPQGERWASSFAFRGFAPRPDLAIYQAALSPAMFSFGGRRRRSGDRARRHSHRAAPLLRPAVLPGDVRGGGLRRRPGGL
jgi:alkanesulfonate monooxygenase SsuD/methylene tetrahydromethanopterin reductase-like flavin-dependent oxidoreductase (luciferase family)